MVSPTWTLSIPGSDTRFGYSLATLERDGADYLAVGAYKDVQGKFFPRLRFLHSRFEWTSLWWKRSGSHLLRCRCFNLGMTYCSHWLFSWLVLPASVPWRTATLAPLSARYPTLLTATASLTSLFPASVGYSESKDDLTIPDERLTRIYLSSTGFSSYFLLYPNSVATDATLTAKADGRRGVDNYRFSCLI